MKVVAINGSPQGEKGNTALILGPFLEGLKFLHILTAQATLGNMRVTIRGREIL